MARKKGQKKILNLDIQGLIDSNTNVNQIIRYLSTEKNAGKFSPQNIKNFVLNNYKKTWDKNLKEWVLMEEEDFNKIIKEKQNKNIFEGQQRFDIDDDLLSSNSNKESKEEFFQTDLSKDTASIIDESIHENKMSNVDIGEDYDSGTRTITEVTDNIVNSSESDTPSIDNSEKNSDISLLLNILMSNITAMLNRIDELDKNIKDIKKVIDMTAKRSLSGEKSVPVDDIIRIYTSDKNKRSVNINSEIKDKVERYIRDSYGIKDNESLVINTALLLALYKTQ